jgi:hypothetical protein
MPLHSFGRNRVRRSADLGLFQPQQIGAAAGSLGSAVHAAADDGPVNELFAQMRNVLNNQHLVAERDAILLHQVLVDLPHVAHVRHDR